MPLSGPRTLLTIAIYRAIVRIMGQIDAVVPLPVDLLGLTPALMLGEPGLLDLRVWRLASTALIPFRMILLG